jgi:drug/metabolite transporter (DMT)-like permease
MMNQISSTSSRPVLGASFMFVASLAFAGSNILQSVLPTPAQYGGYGMASTGMAFWQYLIATVFALPLILRIGLGNLRTRHPLLHEIRAFVSALGVHVFVYGFAAGVPVWQMVTLLAVGPLFIVLGSIVFLGERAAPHRIIAAILAFAGAIMVSGIGAGNFSWMTLVPIAAAALWATTDVLTKYLSREETPETLTVSLLVLITPNHLLILLAATSWAALLPGLTPTGLATGFPFQLPMGPGLMLLVLLGVLTALSQYLLAFGYKVADATLLQPIGDLKVPLSGLLGWALLGQVPTGWFWLGAAMILAASIFVVAVEAQRHGRTLAAA